MELKRAEAIAVDTIRYYAPSYIFKWDKSVRRFGWCHSRRRIISISRHLTVLNSEEEFINTLLHEIAHALAPVTAHHNAIWQGIAKSIGCIGERVYGAHVVTPDRAWVGTCPNGHTIMRHRKRTLSCSACSPRFSYDYLFKWERQK